MKGKKVNKMKETKITKRDKLIEAIAVLKNEATGVVTVDELVEFLENEVTLLDSRKAKDKERAAKKKAEVDELEVAIKKILGDEWMTIADILEKIEGIEDVTPHKIANRLGSLVKGEVAEKTLISVPGADGKKTKKTAYKAL